MPEPRTGQFPRMMFAYSICYLAMVMPLSSLSIQVAHVWKMSNFMAGLTTGVAFFVTLLCRKRSGDLTDRMGGKHACLRGILWYMGGSAVCCLAVIESLPTLCRFAALILGRMIIGFGESTANVGLSNWAIDLMGVQKAGRVIAILGMSMYAAVAIGGQTGFFLFKNAGFGVLMAASALAPVLSYLIIRGCPDQPYSENRMGKSSLFEVIGRIWRFSLPVTFHAAGYAVLGAFLAKTFLSRGWPYAGWGLTFCGIGFVVMRICFGHFPDRYGGLPVAAASAGVEVFGLFLLWLAPGPIYALAGSFLTGAGCSMIFPSLGLEIIRTSPKELRGASISGYNIFIDLAYGFAGPIAGLFADRLGDEFVYLFAAAAAAVGMVMLFNLSWRRRRGLRT